MDAWARRTAGPGVANKDQLIWLVQWAIVSLKVHDTCSVTKKDHVNIANYYSASTTLKKIHNP